MKKPYFVGISGGSASGKSFLLRKILQTYPREQVTLISQDNYYIDRSKLPVNDKGDYNFDHPDAVNLDALHVDLEKLSRNETVTLMEYTFGNPNIVPKEITYHPSPIILVEGLFTFYNPKVSDLLDLRIFVDADEHIKLSRRIKRDLEERGYKLNEILYYYEEYVVPMYRRYVEPYKDICDMVLPNNHHMDRAIRVLLHHFDAVLAK
jgi:uridine kinase